MIFYILCETKKVFIYKSFFQTTFSKQLYYSEHLMDTIKIKIIENISKKYMIICWQWYFSMFSVVRISYNLYYNEYIYKYVL